MLNLANSINRLNLLVQQTKLTESLQQHTQQSRSRMIAGTPQTVFIGDLPKELSLVELYEFLKESVGDCEVVLKRPALKYFYYAFCRFPDIMQARKLLNEIKFPEMHGKVCRALPYDKELLRNSMPRTNLFVKGFGAHWSHKDLHDNFKKYGTIVSARVSIKSDYESRGFGFVQFEQTQAAEKACQEMDGKQICLSDGVQFTVRVADFMVKSERLQPADSFNNLFVKNLPANATEQDLKSQFEQFGPTVSVKIDESHKFAFVAFQKNEDAQTALAHFTSLQKVEDDDQLRVVKCQKREQRDLHLKKEHLKMMKDLARNNLYFKGFPCDGQTSTADLTEELKTFFGNFGEIKSLKLMTKRMVVEDAEKDTLLGFGFVSFQSLESAQKCRFDVSKELFRGAHKIYANPFEWKELRSAHKMEQIDQKELHRYLQMEHSKKTSDVLEAVREDLGTEQGQLLLRVLALITKVNQDKAKSKEERKRSYSRELRKDDDSAAPKPQDQPNKVQEEESKEQQPAPQQPAQQVPAEQQQTRVEKEQQIISQVYSVRFQTLITGASYRDSDQEQKKQLLGTFIYETVKMFLDQMLLARGIVPNESSQQDLTPKITGMIMSLPLAHLTIGISTYQGLFQKVQEAMQLLINRNQHQ